MVGAAREPPAFLIGEAQRRQRRLLELQREGGLVLLGPGDGGEIFVHPPHADGLLAQVVGLFDVERQDLVGDRALGDHQRQDALRAQLLERGQPVIAVRRPVGRRLGLLADDDDRVEEALGLVHRLGEAANVGVGDVALEGGGRDLLERERGQHQRVAAQGLAIGRQHCAAVAGDGVRQVLQLRRRRLERQLRRAELGGAQLDATPPPRRPARLLRPPLRLRCGSHRPERCHTPRSEWGQEAAEREAEWSGSGRLA